MHTAVTVRNELFGKRKLVGWRTPSRLTTPVSYWHEENAKAESAQSIGSIDPTPPLHPLTKRFDRALFRKTFVVRTEDGLPPQPQPGVEYTVPADGVVVLTATCLHKKNENGLHIFGQCFDADGNLFALGSASVQVNPERGINIIENSTTIPVTAGGTFLWLGVW